MKATATANANIALVKYWGKRDSSLILPHNGSLSMSCEGLSAKTTVEFGDFEKDEITINDEELARRLRKMWTEKMGEDIMMDDDFMAQHSKGMGAEDFPYFTTDPPIRSVYFSVGGTPKADIDAEEAGGPKVPSHHSPFFKVSPEPSIKTGVEATVLALLDLMKK